MSSCFIFRVPGKFIGLFLFFIIFALLTPLAYGKKPNPSVIRIFVDGSAGEPLSDLFKPSVAIMGRGWRWPVYKEGDPVLTKFMDEVGFGGTFRTYVYLDRTGFGKDGGLHFGDFLFWLKKIKARGGRVIISLIGMPRELSSCRKDCDHWDQEYKWAMSPPTNYKDYEELVFKVLKFFSVENGLTDILYEVWAEPDHPGYWRGSTDEYLKLYHSFANATTRIKRRYKVQVRIGGAGTMSWNGYRRRGESREAEVEELSKSINCRLIKYCGQNNLPLDFVSFHRYDNNSRYHSTYKVGYHIRKWLKESELSADIPIILTEWNFHLDNKERNNEKGASFIPAMLYDMDKAGINYHTFFSIQDFDQIDPAPSGLGLFTLFGVAKPSYNVFKMLSRLGPERLKTVIKNDANGGAVATRDKKGKISILLWNYPQLNPMKAYERALFGSPSSGPYFRKLGKREQSKFGELVAKAAQKEDYDRHVKRLPVDKGVQQDIANAIWLLRSYVIGQTHPSQLHIHIKDPVKKDRIQYRRWMLDRDRSNGYRDNLQFLMEIKLRTLHAAAESIAGRGMKGEDLEKFLPLLEDLITAAHKEDLKKIKDIRRKIESLPLSIKKNVKKVVDLFEKKMGDVRVKRYDELTRRAQSINQRPSFKLQQVESKTIAYKNPLEFRVSMPPFSVSLITLK